ncbi:GNAT family N-acetyltransferase [Phyllobacterium endophyticum]|jgi:aminoglycoside 6'-N-acetyltransferase|uniref:GNAT family N-acetyltransferase n=1 Tax=Phyllobacterium endophyticum TaxID=1149773 RepID=A0A2P7AZ75_9HYPH|nr:GNAT family N-acetyltransferase [Phyllobacterium endophyticum]MBB3235905.1 aminoglycoside 6'-N-acetyltransferase [Phyllobacterium endophyticum]PSH59508.1 GNAT family N-acetyltransferase [Phyllobacterium endophyticum]TYR41646.1 acetyltransferase [Phyllobacterium endophyticum]
MPDKPAYRYRFVPVEPRHLNMISEWLAEPHVATWWDGNPEEEMALIAHHMDSVSVEPFIIMLGDEAIGYLQTYDPHLEDDHPYQDQPTGTLGLDQFIGESYLIGQGHGPRLLDEFVSLLFEEGVPRVIVDPDPANTQAIRAYEKAGFVAFDTRTSIYGPALMMARDNPDLASEQSPEEGQETRLQ